jgi:hypothetical protein
MTTVAGTTLSGPYGSNSGSCSTQNPGEANCTGPITARFDFHADPNIPGDTPPPFVVIQETASATWTGNIGSCSDGLGDSQQLGGVIGTTGPYSGTSHGTKYSAYANPGQSFVWVGEPTADGIGNQTPSPGPPNGGGPSGDAVIGRKGGGVINPLVLITGQPITAQVTYSALAYSPQAYYTGTTRLGLNTDILAGQTCSASVGWVSFSNTNNAMVFSANPGSCTSSYQWSVPGTIFASWNADINTATLNSSPALSVQNPIWTWASGGSLVEGPAHVSPSVAINVYYNGSTVGSGTIHNDLRVFRPYVDPEPLYDTGQAYYGTGTIGTSQPTMGVYSGEDYGAEIGTTLGTPDEFGYVSNGIGGGASNFCQLANVDVTTDDGFAHNEITTNGQYWLDTAADDTSWGYDQGGCFNCREQNFPSPTKNMVFQDRPAVSLMVTYWAEWSSYFLSYKFYNYAMYLPPGNGVGVQWVPINYTRWHWLSSGNSPYAGTPASPAFDDQAVPTDIHPVWSQRLQS